MGKITIEIDDATYSSVSEMAAAQHLTIEQWLQRQLEHPERLLPLTLENSAHRKILAALGNETEGRDDIHDRERIRAEVYAENRRKLLKLIDNSPGDMGSDGWRGERPYER